MGLAYLYQIICPVAAEVPTVSRADQLVHLNNEKVDFLQIWRRSFPVDEIHSANTR